MNISWQLMSYLRRESQRMNQLFDAQTFRLGSLPSILAAEIFCLIGYAGNMLKMVNFQSGVLTGLQTETPSIPRMRCGALYGRLSFMNGWRFFFGVWGMIFFLQGRDWLGLILLQILVVLFAGWEWNLWCIYFGTLLLLGPSGSDGVGRFAGSLMMFQPKEFPSCYDRWQIKIESIKLDITL